MDMAIIMAIMILIAYPFGCGIGIIAIRIEEKIKERKFR